MLDLQLEVSQQLDPEERFGHVGAKQVEQGRAERIVTPAGVADGDDQQRRDAYAAFNATLSATLNATFSANFSAARQTA